jgi:hypothetical protein
VRKPACKCFYFLNLCSNQSLDLPLLNPYKSIYTCK